jgi:hypothetical protein
MNDADMRHVWMIMSAMAAAVTALAQMAYKEMTPIQVALTLFSGFAFAIFFMPAIAQWMGVAEDNIRLNNAIIYIGGTGWNILLPFAIQKAKAGVSLFGGKDAA